MRGMFDCSGDPACTTKQFMEYSIIAEAKRRLELWRTGKDKCAIHTNLRLAIFGLNVANGGRSEYETVQQEYLHTDSVDGKDICLVAMGRTKEASLVKEYLDFVFSDAVAVQDIHNGAAALAANVWGRYLMWEYLKAHWDMVASQLATNTIVIERFLGLALPKFADYEVAKDIASFFGDKDQRGYDRALVIVLDSIRTNARYRERDEKRTLEWLASHGYV